MSSDSKPCDRSGCRGIVSTVELEDFDSMLIPDDIRADLMKIEVCEACGHVIFYVDDCSECTEPGNETNLWTCAGTGTEVKH